MTTFDRIKVVFPERHIEIIKGFRTYSEDECIKGKSYLQKHPCYVAIGVNYNTNMARIEFTSKVLKQRYDEKINYNNIAYCLEAINSIGVCKLDVDSILEDAEVEKCDVTKDVEGIDLRGLKDYIVTHIENYNKWSAETYQHNNNVCLHNKVQKNEQKKYLEIYDKERELSLSKNKSFRCWAGEDVVRKMKGKIRFEVKLNHYNLVQTMLHIENRRLMTVLKSEANPITELLKKMLREDSERVVAKKWTQYKNQCILQCHNWDLNVLEEKMRYLCGKNYNTNLMDPFRHLVDERNRTQTPVPQFDFQTICAFDGNDVVTTETDSSPFPTEYWTVSANNIAALSF